ncbi:MAG: protein-L-isoaspartate(D-aspartate) O-methyltransferase [bacterium]|nr:protein-L-isoaspartate(D-aspartate) O-methyltransferase [bacterium]
MKWIKKVFLVIQVLLLCLVSCNDRTNKDTGQDKYAARRKIMVETQIKGRGIKDKLVLDAMLKVPRHEFVPGQYKDLSYFDSPLPIGEEQTISQPYIVAYMTEVLKLKGDEKALEIGTGSGYQAAVLAEIVKELYTIEIIEKLGKRAEKILKDLDYKNVHVIIGDGYDGYPSEAPFDAVIVTAAPENIPQPLIDQLKPGGRMVIPVGSIYQNLMLIEKTEEGIIESTLIPVRFVPMTGKIKK